MAKSHDPPTAPYTYTKSNTPVSDVEIARAAYAAGFRGNALTTAIAVAIGESHGNATALNDKHEFSVGLWQINVHGYLAKRLQQLGLFNWTDLYNPDNNAKAAYLLSAGGRKFGAWSVYRHNGHLKYMDRAQAAANVVTNATPVENMPTFKNDPIPQFYGVQPSNILPASSVNVSDPTVIIILIAVVSVIIIGIVLMKRRET